MFLPEAEIGHSRRIEVYIYIYDITRDGSQIRHDALLPRPCLFVASLGGEDGPGRRHPRRGGQPASCCVAARGQVRHDPLTEAENCAAWELTVQDERLDRSHVRLADGGKRGKRLGHRGAGLCAEHIL